MNLTPVLQNLYPEGSYGGQCAAWAETLADFGPVGDSYSQKKRYVDLYGIIAPNIAEVGKGFRVGDVVVTSEGTFMGFGAGHVAIIADIVNGQPIAAESNFKKDEKVRYGRPIPLNKIYGIIRAPLKFNLGQLQVNYSVLFNNYPWAIGFLDSLQQKILAFTNNKLKVNFFPLLTKLTGYTYETIPFPFTGQMCTVIAKSWLDRNARPLAFSSENNPPHVYALVIPPDQWQGSITGGQELAYCNPSTKPCQIQIASGAADPSPWYPDLKLVEHALIHELSHFLHYVNGLDDTTHNLDNPTAKRLAEVFNDLDYTRVMANL